MSTDIKAAQNAVHNFMAAGRQAVAIVPSIPSDSILYRRAEMLYEEISEFEDAANEWDLVEMVDAVADIIYVALGAACELGVDIEPIIENVIESNNSKIDWQSAKPWAVHDNGKIAKDEHYQPPRIAGLIAEQRAKR